MNIIHTCTLSYGNIVHDNHQSSTSPHELHMHKHLHMLYDCLAYRCLLSKLMYEHSYYHQLYPIVSCLVNKGCLCVYQKACYELSRPPDPQASYEWNLVYSNCSRVDNNNVFIATCTVMTHRTTQILRLFSLC